METLTLGNLMDWDLVVEKLEGLKKENGLDDCQEELIRILRYPDNWRLREMALEYIGYVQNPTENLMLSTLNIMTDNTVYYEARILAASALVELAERETDVLNGSKTITREAIIENMESILSSTHPPLLQECIKKCLTRINGE